MNFNLTDKEMTVIYAKHKGLKNKDIKQQNKISTKEFQNLENSIFSKLNVNNWINVYGILFQSYLIERDLESQFWKSNLKECALRIKRVYKVNNLTKNERKLMVYNYLLNLHTELQYKYIFKYS